MPFVFVYKLTLCGLQGRYLGDDPRKTPVGGTWEMRKKASNSDRVSPVTRGAQGTTAGREFVSNRPHAAFSHRLMDALRRPGFPALKGGGQVGRVGFGREGPQGLVDAVGCR